MKATLLFGMTLLLTSCATAPEIKEDNLIHCTNARDSSQNFSYDIKNVEVWKSEEYGVETFSIKSASGKQINLNTYEIQNFVCKG